MNLSVRLRRTVAILGVLAAAALAQEGSGPAPQASATTAQPLTAMRAYPNIAVAGRQLTFVGSFAADGRFKRVSKFSHAIDRLITASVPYEPPDTAFVRVLLPASDGPRSAAIRANKRIVEDVAAPSHAVELAPVEGRTLLGEVRDVVARIMSGTERILWAPQAVTTDSRQRVIITDPSAHAIHVLDSEGGDSFHIFGGPGRRLQAPNGVAVDADDNIYVADAERGKVLVYAPDGTFRYYLGEFKGENIFQRPTGIAIDRKTRRLYVLDTPRHLLYVLDLQGRVLARIGKRGGGTGPGEFNYPMAIAATNDELLVIDRHGSRLQVLDGEGNLRKQFNIEVPQDALANWETLMLQRAIAPALCADARGDIYVGDVTRGRVRIYDHDGRLLGAFGRPGSRFGEFATIAGMWTDSNDRMYVVDANRLPVQVFQLGPVPPDAPVAGQPAEADPLHSSGAQ